MTHTGMTPDVRYRNPICPCTPEIENRRGRKKLAGNAFYAFCALGFISHVYACVKAYVSDNHSMRSMRSMRGGFLYVYSIS
jgi:hypothetical protein